MKLKIVTAVLLFCCFAWLAVLSGAVPVLTEAEAVALRASVPSAAVASLIPAPEESPAPPSPSPTPTETPLAEPEKTPAAETEPASPTPSPASSIVSTTITADDILDNDTYYTIDTGELLDGGFRLPLDSAGYQILIIHTHATEAYTPTADEPYEAEENCRTTDPEHSVIRVGQELADALSAQGLSVLHDTALHDHPSYNGSYNRSGAAIEEYLEAYPTIRIVIDLHRDALEDGDTVYRTDAGIDGADAAQMMFVMGTDVNLDHPDWQENLKLALTLQSAVAERWPTLMRPIVLCDYRYNQQLTPGSLLLEVGTSGNTLEEALTAADLFAEAVGPLLASWLE